MCGIAGLWGRYDQETVRTMMARQRHRGPDAERLYGQRNRSGVLGHLRLAIMDPDGGDQPISSDDGEHIIIVNGEIYNWVALRSRFEEWYRFKTRSDSEAALAAYAVRGSKCVGELDGMFAFAVLGRDHLFVARDPLGIKPLYYGRRGSDLLFASEIKALIGLVDDVREFAPGSWFHSHIGTQSYYEVPDPKPVVRTSEEHMAAVREVLERSVRKRLMSDVPVGIFLSGGLDRSIIAALARPHVHELHTFAVGIEGSRDLEAARTVADHLDTHHHEYLLTPEEIRQQLPELLYHLESYDQDLVRSAIPCYFTARLASRDVKVILTGEGADELFAGYRYYREYHDPVLLQYELHRSVGALHNINLQRVDRMTMAHSVEGRVPFLDVEMVELAQSIPPQLKLNTDHSPHSIDKWILRKACENLLPAAIVWRDKEQFDQGSGTVEVLEDVIQHGMPVEDAESYMEEHHASRLRSIEECVYHKLLCEAYSNPEPVLKSVARWADHAVGAAPLASTAGPSTL